MDFNPVDNIDRMAIGIQQGLMYDDPYLQPQANQQDEGDNQRRLTLNYNSIDKNFVVYEVLIYGLGLSYIAACVVWCYYFFSIDAFESIVLILLALNEIRRICVRAIQAKREKSLEKQTNICWSCVGYLMVAPILAIAGLFLFPEYNTAIIALTVWVMVYFSAILYFADKIRKLLIVREL